MSRRTNPMHLLALHKGVCPGLSPLRPNVPRTRTRQRVKDEFKQALQVGDFPKAGRAKAPCEVDPGAHQSGPVVP